jgi:hypothetical protein
MQIARKALEPPELSEEDGGDEGGQPPQWPLSAGVLRHWSVVRCGCVEGVLATAILAGQHADVWDAASMLLREHCRRAFFCRTLGGHISSRLAPVCSALAC